MKKKKGRTKITENIIDDIVRVFGELGNMKETAKMLNLGQTTIKKFLLSRGVKTTDRKFSRTFKDNSKCHRVYTENDITDSRIKSYILGWVATDGCLLPENTIQLALKSSDEYMVRWVGSQLVTPEPHINRSKPTISRFVVKAPKFYNDCLDIGITPAKSLTLDVDLEKFNDDDFWYFFRGVLDGNGCVRDGKGMVDIASASFKFVHSLKDKLEVGSIYADSRGGRQEMYRLCFNVPEIMILLDKIPNEPYMLRRKSDRLEKLRRKYFWSGYLKHPKDKYLEFEKTYKGSSITYNSEIFKSPKTHTCCNNNCHIKIGDVCIRYCKKYLGDLYICLQCADNMIDSVGHMISIRSGKEKQKHEM